MLDLEIRFCKASASPTPGLKTTPLVGAGLTNLATFADLAVFVPRREINWFQSFARRGWCYKDYELISHRPPQYMFERKDDFTRPTPMVVTLFGKNTPGFSDEVLQGELVTYVMNEAFLCYQVVNRDLNGLQPEHEKCFTNACVTAIVGLDAAKDLCEKLDKASRKQYRINVIEAWDSKSFLLVQPIFF